MQIEIQFDLNPGQAWGREGVIFHRGVPASGQSLVTPALLPHPHPDETLGLSLHFLHSSLRLGSNPLTENFGILQTKA